MSTTLRSATNLFKALLLLVILGGAFGAVGWLVGGYRLLSLFAFAALLTGAAVYWSGDRIVLGIVRARALPQGEAPGLHSTVERLAARSGVAKPKLYLLADGHPRAFAVGRGPGGSSLAVSSGLLAALPPAELEGVVAHELAHVRARDVVPQTVVVVIATALVDVTRFGGYFSRALLYVLGPLAAALVHLMLSPRRELAADRDAAQACDSPHGLADALVRLEQAIELVEFEASPATEPLYTINPFLERGLAGLFVTHPPVAKRVQELRALDPDWREKLRAA